MLALCLWLIHGVRTAVKGPQKWPARLECRRAEWVTPRKKQATLSGASVPSSAAQACCTSFVSCCSNSCCWEAASCEISTMMEPTVASLELQTKTQRRAHACARSHAAERELGTRRYRTKVSRWTLVHSSIRNCQHNQAAACRAAACGAARAACAPGSRICPRGRRARAARCRSRPCCRLA